MPAPHRLSVVIPVYRGEQTLPGVIEDLRAWTEPFTTPDGHVAVVSEVLLVHDCGPDRSDDTIRRLAAEVPWVQAVWLSRNFGQHAATLAGMSSSGGDWVVTMDEDGQHDSADIGTMLDRAMATGSDVVYAAPRNPAPHGAGRNLASRAAKRSARWFSGGAPTNLFHSYRLVLGDVARSVAAYAGAGVYLDIALSWVSRRTTSAPVTLRTEGRPSGYRWRTLMSHYWRMVLTGGTRMLRLVSLIGLASAALGVVLIGYIVVARLTGRIEVGGWASLMTVLLLTSGAVLFALGIVAEYLGAVVNMAMGRPLYLIVRDRADGPLGQDHAGS